MSLRPASPSQEIHSLFSRHYQTVFKNAFLLTSCEQTSQDITQDVFIKIWTKKDRLPPVQDWDAFLHTISKNVAIDYLRKRRREKIMLSEIGYHRYGRPARNEVMDGEMYRALAEIVHRLPPRQKLVYLLKREYGWDRVRIARCLRISPMTVKANLQLALRTIKKELNALDKI